MCVCVCVCVCARARVCVQACVFIGMTAFYKTSLACTMNLTSCIL